MIKTYWVDKDNFERALHGNRSIDCGSMEMIIGETIQIFCSDIQYYSFPIEIVVKYKFYQRSTIKGTKGVRTSRFPFVD